MVCWAGGGKKNKETAVMVIRTVTERNTEYTGLEWVGQGILIRSGVI